MGIPKRVLTDNMKSVSLGRDALAGGFELKALLKRQICGPYFPALVGLFIPAPTRMAEHIDKASFYVNSQNKTDRFYDSPIIIL